MRFINKNWGLKFFIFGLVLGCGVSSGMAGEDRPLPQATGAADSAVREEPAVSFETEGDFSLGYRWVSTEDSLKAAEHIYPHSSVSFGLNLLSCPLPYRYHVNGEFSSKHDFYSDFGFAYKDLVLFRDILVGVHHNHDHFSYDLPGEPPLDPLDPPRLIYEDRNPEDDYYIDFVSNLMSFRLKAPDFPFHTFVNYRHVEREGKIQQRFLLGHFDNLVKTSASRDIDWKSNAVKLGANSHLGPLEIEYAYDQAKFDPGGNNVLNDPYTYRDHPDPRPNGTYPHNVIPETESSAHSIKLHSSYTGSIVGAVSFSNLFKKNNYSLTESSTWKGAFDLSWIPDPAMGFFFKYRHRNVDMDTPVNVTLIGYPAPIPPVRQGISYDRDVFSLSSRYKPVHLLTLYANYEFSHLKRKDITDWEALSDQTNIHKVTLKANARPIDKLKLTAKYEYKNYDQPSYNTTPDISNKLRLTTTYTPSPSLNIYLEYSLFLTERDPLRYLLSGGDPSPPLETGGRDSRGDQILASLSSAISPKASLIFSWFYQRWDVEQDMVYGLWPIANIPQYLRDDGVPYTDEANSFSLSLHYIPREDFTVAADLTHTITKGTTGYSEVIGVAPFSLSDLSNIEASETSFSVDLAKKLPKDWEIGLRLYFDIYNDKVPDLLDGNVFTTTFSLKRYF